MLCRLQRSAVATVASLSLRRWPVGRFFKVAVAMSQKEVQMSRILSSTIPAVAVILTIAWLGSLMPASGQSPIAEKAAPKAAKAIAPGKSSRTLALTADGQPDIQGIYARRGIWGPNTEGLESNGPHGAENPLEDTLYSEPPDGVRRERNTTENFNQGGAVGPVALTGPPPVEPRRLGLVDPPNKVLPWKPEEDQKRREFLKHTSPAASLRYVEYDARCALPGLFLNGGPFEFIQPPKEVVILSEYQHYTRTIHLDGRPHVGSNIHLFMGDSIGHWERNTLIVDTTNFNEFTAFSREIPYLSDALHTIERFTIVDENNIDYEVTIDDPKLFTKPWKAAALYRKAKKEYEIMEYACAEGSVTLENIFGKPPGE